jgi:glycerophosphoryl diester phosphodiesterase
LRNESKQKLERLEDVLEKFRGKCLINIDRSWFYWREIIELLNRIDMKDQILLKSEVEEELLAQLEKSGTEIMYMPIMKKAEEWDIVEKYNINVAAAELIFTDLKSSFLSEEFMGKLKHAGIAPWVNAITLNDDTILSGLLDDNNAIRIGFDETWGRLIELGFEIIQTDWPALLKGYIIKKFNNK